MNTMSCHRAISTVLVWRPNIKFLLEVRFVQLALKELLHSIFTQQSVTAYSLKPWAFWILFSSGTKWVYLNARRSQLCWCVAMMISTTSLQYQLTSDTPTLPWFAFLRFISVIFPFMLVFESLDCAQWRNSCGESAWFFAPGYLRNQKTLLLEDAWKQFIERRMMRNSSLK